MPKLRSTVYIRLKTVLLITFNNLIKELAHTESSLEIG